MSDFYCCSSWQNAETYFNVTNGLSLKVILRCSGCSTTLLQYQGVRLTGKKAKKLFNGLATHLKLIKKDIPLKHKTIKGTNKPYIYYTRVSKSGKKIEILTLDDYKVGSEDVKEIRVYNLCSQQ